MRVSVRNMRFSCVCSGVLATCLWGFCSARAPVGTPAGAPRIPGQNPNGIQVYLRAGLKTHGPGQHDYPQFLADWSKFLTQHGAVVSGSLHAPLAQELEGAAVMVMRVPVTTTVDTSSNFWASLLSAGAVPTSSWPNAGR